MGTRIGLKIHNFDQALYSLIFHFAYVHFCMSMYKPNPCIAVSIIDSYAQKDIYQLQTERILYDLRSCYKQLKEMKRG